jgi:TonB family protein
VNQITAPSTVPETVTPVQSVSTSGTSDSDTGPSTGTVDGPIGVPWGTKDSIGDLDAPPATIPTPIEQKIYEPGGEVKAPEVIRRVEPAYPPALQKMRLSGSVVLRCVIDKNGHVRDARVVFASHQAFADAVVKSLDGWRYKPASMRGEAVDCYLDLTVNFGVR